MDGMLAADETVAVESVAAIGALTAGQIGAVASAEADAFAAAARGVRGAMRTENEADDDSDAANKCGADEDEL
jgi:hypothetical protein